MSSPVFGCPSGPYDQTPTIWAFDLLETVMLPGWKVAHRRLFVSRAHLPCPDSALTSFKSRVYLPQALLAAESAVIFSMARRRGVPSAFQGPTKSPQAC